MGILVSLPPLVNEVPGAVALVELPRVKAQLRALYILGRRPDELQRITFKVNGVTLCDLVPYVDDEGRDRTGGECGAALQALRGFSPDRLVMPMDPIDLANVGHACLIVELSKDAAREGRTKVFAKLWR